MTEAREVQPLSASHAEGLRVLFREPDVAAAAGFSAAPSPLAVADYIAAATEAQEDGRSFVFVLTDRAAVLGVCRLIGVRGVPRLIVAVGHAYRGQGNGSFLVGRVLEFAFENLGLDRVTATGPCLRLVSQYGLQADGQGLARQEWLEARTKTG